MRMTWGLPLCGLLTAVGLSTNSGMALALPATAGAASKHETATVEVGDRWYRDYEDDDYYYPPEYYLPPPPPPPPVARVVPPPAAVYEPPVYGWISPPRPSNCGKYRYWNGERCADARFDPPYVGPRW
ncbi:hypothetical protein [Hyphomicrobium sp.]|uniref:hypothetical protein n=1 Tax=Hyphomicrobium sp. TaxID=82 RepID=UPI002E34F200|nr:hypothetical protein [Hyphomicrobium sp.]HEX2841610.1 hypothetical protein [Hyphomicrobium sp.]